MYKLNDIIAVRADKKVYRDGDKVIKVFERNYSPSAVLNEALNLSYVEEVGVLVPKLHAVTLIDDKWAIVVDYIEGRSLMELLDDGTLTAAQMLSQMIAVQRDIHAKVQPMLSRLIDKMHRKVCETDFDAAVRYELHMRLKNMPRHTKICHGDLCPSNIIVTPNGQYYTIDWSHATQGNGSADVARAYLTFNLDGHGDLAEMYLDMFCTAAGLQRELVIRWLPIVAASQSVKNKAEETERLRKIVTAVEYE